MDQTTFTIEFLKHYLAAIGITDYQVKASQDTLGYLISLTIPKNNPRIGVLIGRGGRNIRILKQVLRIVGFCERINPCLVLKLVDNNTTPLNHEAQN